MSGEAEVVEGAAIVAFGVRGGEEAAGGQGVAEVGVGEPAAEESM